jgi:DNA-binding LacI/PurR family transcriptional regulator
MTAPQDDMPVATVSREPHAPPSAPVAKTVTLKTIADACQLSTFTVSLALRGDSRIKATTAERICRTATAMGYDPAVNQAARRMALKRQGREVISHIVALFSSITDTETVYQTRILGGVLSGLTREGFALLVNHLPSYRTPAPPDLSPVFGRGDVDGVIGLMNPTHFGLFDQLQRLAGFQGHPCLSMIWPGTVYASVITDDEGGMYAATRHLLGQGHRAFLFLAHGGDDDFLYQRRLAGIARALDERGLTMEAHVHVQPAYARWCNPALFRRQLGADRSAEEPLIGGPAHPLNQFLDAHPEVTAILTWNDAVALHAWATMENAGRAVPRDISLIGFDDTDPMLDRHGENLLTSVRLPLHQLGEAAARLIVKCILDQAPDAQHLVLPTALHVRQSTAPAARR